MCSGCAQLPGIVYIVALKNLRYSLLSKEGAVTTVDVPVGSISDSGLSKVLSGSKSCGVDVPSKGSSKLEN